MLRKAIPIALVLLVFGLLPSCAQEFSFRSFGGTEGLRNLAIRGIYQDRAGFLWASTEDGIFRYDGDRFEPFGVEEGMTANCGAAFGDAPDGSLLTGGSFGLYHLSGSRFERIAAPFKSINWAQGIQADGQGHTFLGTDAGLVELYSHSGSPGFSMRVLPRLAGTSDAAAYGVLIDGDVLWYGCGLELCRKDASGTRVFSRDSGLPALAVLVILKDRAGNVWVRLRNGGIFEWPVHNAKFQIPARPFPPEYLGANIALDAEGRVMLLSANGVMIGDEKGWQKIDRAAGLRGTVYSAFEDRQHSLWIGFAGRGLVQWRGYGEWESYSAASGLGSDLAYEIVPAYHGWFWVGTEAGLFRSQSRSFGMSFKSVPGLTGFPVHSLQAATNGDLWIGTETRGVARIDPQTLQPEWFGEAEGLIGKAAYTLRFDRQQRLWVATEAGLFLAKPPYRRFARIDALPSTRMWAISEGSDGTLWAGGAGGLFEYVDGGWKTFTRADGLSNTEVLSLGAGPKGVMWVGYRYGGGIDRIHPQPGELPPGGVTIDKGVQRTGTDGLIYFLNFDAAGRLWVGTERGVDVWDGAGWSHYDTNDGLTWDDCNLNAFAAEPDGTVWIGTSAGLSRFQPLAHGAPDAPLDVLFTRLSIGQKDVSGLTNPSFGIHANSLVARYAALNAPRQNGVVFRYRLRGDASIWTETAQRELQFANLAPGAYRLQIQARESDGPWSSHGAEFPFTILTPWYLSWWFTGLCLVIPLSGTGAALRLRFLGAQKRERELIQLVEEKTTDLRLLNEELSQLSFTDSLTGLANRRFFDQVLERECSRLKRVNSSLSLLTIDVDHFKLLNDSQGHQKGDECLTLIGAELTRLCRRKADLAARCGGEEFAVILSETNAADARRFADTVCQTIADLKVPHPSSPVAPFITVSVGVATATREGCSTGDCLVAAADLALYAAKKSGRNRVCIAKQDSPPEDQLEPRSLISA